MGKGILVNQTKRADIKSVYKFFVQDKCNRRNNAVALTAKALRVSNLTVKRVLQATGTVSKRKPRTRKLDDFDLNLIKLPHS